VIIWCKRFVFEILHQARWGCKLNIYFVRLIIRFTLDIIQGAILNYVWSHVYCNALVYNSKINRMMYRLLSVFVIDYKHLFAEVIDKVATGSLIFDRKLATSVLRRSNFEHQMQFIPAEHICSLYRRIPWSCRVPMNIKYSQPGLKPTGTPLAFTTACCHNIKYNDGG